jgi:beta-phosphoglucomutase
MTRFELAIFDLDGVLADSARLHFTAWKSIADELGIPFDEAANEALKGVDRMGSLRAILALDDRTLPEAEMAALAERKNAAYVAAAARMTPADLLPGVAALLDAVAVRGLRAAVASASRNAPLVLDRLGIAGRFGFVANPARSQPKPAPDLFLACAVAAGIAPELCVAFEDAAAGVAAIKAARMRAIGIGDRQVLAAADLVFPSTADVDLEAVLA